MTAGKFIDLDAAIAGPSPGAQRRKKESKFYGLDIRQWYAGIIAPRFDSAEARARLGTRDELDLYFSPIPWLQQATRQMRDIHRTWNPSPFTPHTPGSEDGEYIQLEPQRRSLYERLFSRLGEGSIRGCAAALAATSVGSGALAVPHAFSLVGVGLGAATLVLVTVVSAASLQVLMVAARYTGVDSYAAVLELSLGSHAAAFALDIVMTLNGVGALVCILIFEGDFLPAVLAAPPLGLPSFSVARPVAIGAAALCAWPLAVKEQLSSLQYVALIVPFALLVTVIIVMVDTPEMYHHPRHGGCATNADELGVKWWIVDPRRWLQATAIMVNALANHTNAVPTATQLENPSIARIVKVTVNANFMVLVLFLAIGIAGYLSFGGSTCGDFLLNYPDGRSEIWACRLMLGIIVFIGLPVCMLPTAKSVSQLILRAIGSEASAPSWMHRVCATLLLFLCTSVALVVEDVAAVIGPLGGLLATSLMFWFPAIVFRKLLWPTQPKYIRSLLFLAMVSFGLLGWSSVVVSFLP